MIPVGASFIITDPGEGYACTTPGKAYENLRAFPDEGILARDDYVIFVDDEGDRDFIIAERCVMVGTTMPDDRLRIAEESSNAKSLEVDELRREVVTLRSALKDTFTALSEAVGGDRFSVDLNATFAWVEAILEDDGS